MTESATEDETFERIDWYGEEIAARTYRRCRFADADLTETATRGVVFEDCVFDRVRFNASQHTDSAFINCGFTGCNLFDVRFDDCKLVGSRYSGCVLRPIHVSGGDWSFTVLAEADLRGSRLLRVRLREADLFNVDGSKSVFDGVDLSGARLDGIRLDGTDLRGSDLSTLDPRRAELTGAIIDESQAAVVAEAMGFLVR